MHGNKSSLPGSMVAIYGDLTYELYDTSVREMKTPYDFPIYEGDEDSALGVISSLRHTHPLKTVPASQIVMNHLCRLIFLIISCLSFAASNPLPVQDGGNARITLHQRPTLTRADGTFDKDKAMRHDLIIRSHFKSDAIEPTRTIRETHALKYPDDLRRRQSVPLSASDEASEWLGSLSIGTPPRKFVVNFDSMSR
ncbi:hypothetical protein M422DRAFT_56883 [Sphaerobolus stellatus SS14]|uniref:Peptidase A1 domain-containing protein n=1 Tax=Sphaerobolus stellatus (strain SS14) TaxID=990650 RepID=A0A0C9T359_SPHS4|nr:hypothetical protein M422DRAFT_56883 [Sphaerobolus stellatus SS14]